MKKFLFGLLVSVLTFSFGTFTFQLINFESKKDSNTEVSQLTQELKIKEVQSIKPDRDTKTIAREVYQEPVIEDNFGWYQLDEDQKMPNLGMIALSKDIEQNFDNPRKNKTVSFAGVFTEYENFGDQGFVGSAWAEIDNKKAKFKTRKINGFEYRFEGTFFNNKTSGKKGEKVLRGTLQKFKQGKKIAQMSGDFGYYEPQCWH